MGTDWEALANSAKSRSEIYGLLATVFKEEPSRDFVKELRGPALSRVFSDMEVELGARFYSDPISKVAEDLGLEYTRLFIGPGRHISAHESIFAEIDGDSGGLWGKTTVEVKKFIETTGLGYHPEFTGIPDHISVELEFMQKLSAWEADRWKQEDQKSADYCRTVQRLFLEEHLLRWISQFCDAVMAQAEMPFYWELAELTKNYMEFERQSMAAETAA